MSKEAISNQYLHDMLEEHGHKEIIQRQSNRYFVVTGVSEGNIGQRIFGMLKHEFNGSIVTRMDLKDGDLNYAEQLDYHDVDTLIMCHAQNEMNWVENFLPEDIQTVIDSSLTSHVKMVSHYVSQTIDAPWRKQIVFVGSMAAKAVLNASSPYCAAKAGLLHFAKCMAWELAPKGYDVYIINPSNVLNTPMTQATIEGLMGYRDITREQAVTYWAANRPRIDPLSKDEIARLVCTLVSGQFPYLSGCSLDLTGGQR